jgi:Flp pilus assembly protein TadG
MSMKSTKRENEMEREGSLARDTRGAVLVEFVVAIFPLLTIFFVFVQLSAIAVAALMTKQAGVVAARAAAVYSNTKNNVPEACGDDGQKKIEEAVTAALGPWAKKMTTEVEVTDTSSRKEPDGVYDLVTVRVTARYRCEVPLGRIICPGGTKTIIETKSMPHQGARYKKSSCGEGADGSANNGGAGDTNGGDWQGGGGRFGGAGATGTWPTPEDEE